MKKKSWYDTVLLGAILTVGIMLYLDLRSEIRTFNSDLMKKIDKVETKVDEVRGYLRLTAQDSSSDMDSE